MSAAAAALADEVVARVLNATGVGKAGGGVPVPVMRAAVEAVAEAFMDHQQRQTAELRKVVKSMKQTLREAQAISPPVPHGLVPYRPDQWRTELRPVLPPKRMNGHGGPSGEA